VQIDLIVIEDEGLRYDIASWGHLGVRHVDSSEDVVSLGGNELTALFVQVKVTFLDDVQKCP
jgi:hypothetical protein